MLSLSQKKPLGRLVNSLHVLVFDMELKVFLLKDRKGNLKPNRKSGSKYLKEGNIPKGSKLASGR